MRNEFRDVDGACITVEKVITVSSLQRTSYLTRNTRGHSGDAVYGWPAVHLQPREGSFLPGVLVVWHRPVLVPGAEGGGAAPATPAGEQEPDGQPGQQQQWGLGQSGAPQPPQPNSPQQPRDRLPVLWPLDVSSAAPLKEARSQIPTYQQSGHKRFGNHVIILPPEMLVKNYRVAFYLLY